LFGRPATAGKPLSSAVRKSKPIPYALLFGGYIAMAKRIIPSSSLPVLNRAFSFFVALLFIIITGCSIPNPVQPTVEAQPTVEEEYKAQKKLLQLQSYVDDEDYMSARFVLSGFQRDFSNTNFYKTYSKRINELVKKIKKETRDIKAEDKIEYFFVPPRLETKLWKEYMSRAERMVSRGWGEPPGITVLRVTFEDEGLESPSVRGDWDHDNQIYVYSGGGGFSNTGNFKSGDAVFVGSEFSRYGRPDPNDKDVPIIGNVIIGGIYHYPINLKMEVQKGKATAFGEVIVRSIPKEYRGNLIVNVEAEGGVKLTDAGVNLKVAGFYSGITMPIKEGRALFDSIGPGNYSVEVASNNNFGSPGQSAVVVMGQTTEVTLNAYRHRIVEIDWRFRRAKDPNNWLSGRKVMKTKGSWSPDGEWENVRICLLDLGDWVDNACSIRSSNGYLTPLTAEGPFEEMEFPANLSSTFHKCTVKEGDVFAWQFDSRQEGILQALFRITKITPVGTQDGIEVVP
jgi:hypothetical protein